jgi:hypothetical protein
VGVGIDYFCFCHELPPQDASVILPLPLLIESR